MLLPEALYHLISDFLKSSSVNLTRALYSAVLSSQLPPAMSSLHCPVFIKIPSMVLNYILLLLLNGLHSRYA